MGRLTNNPLLFPSWGLGRLWWGAPLYITPCPRTHPLLSTESLVWTSHQGEGSPDPFRRVQTQNRRDLKKNKVKKCKNRFFSKEKKTLFVSTNMFVDLAKTKGKKSKKKKIPSPILPTLFRVPGSEHSYSETVFRPRANVAPGSPAECVWRALACAPSFMFTSCKYIFILHSRDPM